MKYPLWKPLLIVLVVVVSALLMYPPERKLKPGLDLAGGTTLTYDVRVPEGVDAQRTISDLIDVLAVRVDPTGTRNLVWRQVAGNRIEVSMALASPAAKGLRETYQQAQQRLLEGNLASGKLRSALRLEGAARDAELDRLAGGDAARRQQLATLAEAQDRLVAAGGYRETQQALETAQAELAALPADATEEQRRPLQERVNSLRDELIQQTIAYRAAKTEFDRLEAELLQSNIDPAELEQAVNRPVTPTRRGQVTRADAVNKLIEDHPARADQIRAVFDAYAQYEAVKGPLDDPNDLIALLRGSGVLEFRIAPTPGQLPDEADYLTQLEQRGPRAGTGRPYRWFPIDDVEQFASTAREQRALEEDPRGYFAARGLVGGQFGDRYYVLLANTPDMAMTRDQNWELASATRGFDELGRNAVNFALNAPGGDLMGAITGPNVGKPMAILLDNEVVSAPNLNSQIRGSGQITGSFSPRELDYLLRTIKAGSTEAELGEYPISVKTTGPQLGQDNLQRGVQAALIAFLLTAFFMITYYFLPGVTAVIALVVNMVILMGVMAMFGATFTLPGIAGIVLTIGMAVDANVLIYERMREELERKADLPTAIRLGYEKALAAILDSNITTFITCVILYYTATADVKGFAITLMVGLVATLFSALFVSRVALELYIRFARPKTLTMLPIVFPGIRQAFTPSIDWMSRKWIFFIISGTLSVAGVTAALVRGADMLDVEFRSGTQVSFELSGDRMMSLGEVRDRLRLYAGVGAAFQRGQTDNLRPEQQAVLPEVRRIVTEADARHEARTREAEAARAAGKDVGGLPDAPDFALLTEATVVTEGTTDGALAEGFSIATLIQDPIAVSDVVKSAFSDVIDVTRPIAFAGMDREIADTDSVFPITTTSLAEVLRRPDVTADAGEYVGGVALLLDELSPPATVEDVRGRIRRMRNQPAYESLGYRPFDVIGIDRAVETTAGEAGEPTYRSLVVVVRDPETNYAESTEALRETGGLAATEWALVRDALQRDTSLASVSSFSSQVSQTMQQQAIAAVLLSMIAIVIYIWFRFGGFHFSFGAIIALTHDVTMVIGLLAISGWLYETALGRVFLLDSFKINLTIIAAILTIIGYSLNDKIVVFDRVRENRGRLSHLTPQIINDSINQTISRTVITGGTTIAAVIALYIVGGPSLHGFAFAMFIGIVVGTYSSIAIAAPAVQIAAWLTPERESRGTLHATTVPEAGGSAPQQA